MLYAHSHHFPLHFSPSYPESVKIQAFMTLVREMFSSSTVLRDNYRATVCRVASLTTPTTKVQYSLHAGGVARETRHL